MDYRVKEILVHINSNLLALLSLSMMAQSVNLSVSHLQHLFKAEMGISIKQYIKDLRLQKACHLLETTNLRIKEIRYQVGASDDTHFVREFKKNIGSYPSEYRRTFRNSRICQ